MRKRRSRAKKRRERKRPSAVVAIYQEAAEVDKLINDANSDAPANETRRLLRVEEHCRGLEDGFGRGNSSLMRATVLIGFDGKQIWPIKQSIDPAFYQLDGRRTAFDCSGDSWRPNSEQQKLKQEQQILEKAQARVDRDSLRLKWEKILRFTAASSLAHGSADPGRVKSALSPTGGVLTVDERPGRDPVGGDPDL